MNSDSMIGGLLRSSKFWFAVVALVKAIVLSLPSVQIPQAVWAAVDALIAVVVGVIAADEVNAMRAARKGSRALGINDGPRGQRLGWIGVALLVTAVAGALWIR